MPTLVRSRPISDDVRLRVLGLEYIDSSDRVSGHDSYFESSMLTTVLDLQSISNEMQQNLRLCNNREQDSRGLYFYKPFATTIYE